jgi:pyrroline-5-carboxylate reductase
VGTGEPFGVAVIGCGNISKQYLANLARFPDVKVLFCADIDAERAKAQAAAYDVPASGSPQQALDHPDVQLVANLTIPAAHAEVASPPGGPCSSRRARPGCGSAARPTPCSARASSRPGG